MKAIIRFNVVMVSVFQAERSCPVDSQNPGSSGVQALNQVRGLCSVIECSMLQSRKGEFIGVRSSPSPLVGEGLG